MKKISILALKYNSFGQTSGFWISGLWYIWFGVSHCQGGCKLGTQNKMSCMCGYGIYTTLIIRVVILTVRIVILVISGMILIIRILIPIVILIIGIWIWSVWTMTILMLLYSGPKLKISFGNFLGKPIIPKSR